ncbi:MAG: DNA repair exonuclease [Bacillota bacterium]|nr:DNA repair exonuclease [Bacillota bacterium]
MGAHAVRCLHLADLHIGWRPRDFGGKEEQRGRERGGLMKKAVDHALDRSSGIDLALVAGDLFETHNPKPHLVEEVIQQLQRLCDAGVPVVTVPGNHDEITYTTSVYKVSAERWPGLLVTCPQPGLAARLDIKGTQVFIYSLAYTGGVTRTSPPVRDFPHTGEAGVHIGVFHGSLGWSGGDRSLPLDAEALGAAGYDYVALGHFHGFSSVTLGKSGSRTREGSGSPLASGSFSGAPSSGGRKAVYCGMTEARGFSDPGTGFFVVATVGPGNAEVETVDAGVRKCLTVTIDLTGLAGLPELESRLRSIAAQAGPDAMLQVSLQGNAGFHFDVESLLGNMKPLVYHLELSSDATFLDAEEIDQWATEPTIRGEFIRRMRRHLAAATCERDRAILEKALSHGLRALEGGSP